MQSFRGRYTEDNGRERAQVPKMCAYWHATRGGRWVCSSFYGIWFLSNGL